MIHEEIKRFRSVLALGSLLIIAAPGVLEAQSGAITGTVLDQVGKPVPGAAIAVKNATSSISGSTNTDADGRFSVNGLAAGTYSGRNIGAGLCPQWRAWVSR